jgi:predicted transcriptional regulator
MSKGTTRRTIRVNDELWNEAQETAEAHGDNLSEVLRDALRAYIEASKP